MPAETYLFYIRNMYIKNKLIERGGIKIKDTEINLANIKTPTYILATKEDHIVPWQSSYEATKIYKGKIKFVLSGSGHVAGVVNHPDKKKYGYWTCDKIEKDANDWFAKSKEHEGSWWIDWNTWLQKEGFAGNKVKAHDFDKGKKYPKAPGDYVKVVV